MKVSPVAAGAVPVVNVNEGQTATPEKLARAKAIASGQEPVAERAPPLDLQVERAQNSMKKIKMRTQRSPDRHMRIEEPVVPAPDAATDPAAEPAANLAPTEQTPAAAEDKPLSPQFAALARQKREIQLAQQKLEADKAALATQSGNTKSLEEYRARIKANALSVLMEEGVTYDQLTEQILAQNQGGADLTALKAELKAELKADIEEQNKSISARETAAEEQVFTQISKDVNQLISQGDAYETIREAGYAPKVLELIRREWKQNGNLLEPNEACDLVENEALSDAIKWAKLKKVQSQLNPAPTQQTTQPVKQDRPGTKVMRTLTNRDGVSSTTLSKRERAIAAMEGRLTK